MGIRSMTGSGPRLGTEDIRELESRLGASLPTAYRAFLLKHNGGRPEPAYVGEWKLDRFLILGYQPFAYKQLWYKIEDMREELPEDVIPVAYEQSGDAICLALTGENRGRVYKWDHEGCAPAIDHRKEYPNANWGDDYVFKPDDWPGHADLTLIAEDFAEFLDSFQDEPDYGEA